MVCQKTRARRISFFINAVIGIGLCLFLGRSKNEFCRWPFDKGAVVSLTDKKSTDAL
jgi:hypothetical protein